MHRFFLTPYSVLTWALFGFGPPTLGLAQDTTDLPPLGGIVSSTPDGSWIFGTRKLDSTDGKIRYEYHRPSDRLTSGSDFAPGVVLDLDAAQEILTTIGSNGRATVYRLEPFSRLINFEVEAESSQPKLGRIRVSATGEWLVTAGNGEPKLFRTGSDTSELTFVQNVPGFQVTQVHANQEIADSTNALELIERREGSLFDFLLGGNGSNSKWVESRQTLNLSLGLSAPHFPEVQAFPGSPLQGSRPHTTLRARGTITIPEPGPWTFAIYTHDEVELSIGDNSFRTTAAVEPSHQTFFAEFQTAGTYPIEVLHWQDRGRAVLELSARSGIHRAWNDGFRLVGAREQGGLSVVSRFAASPINSPPMPPQPGFSVTSTRIPSGIADHQEALKATEDPNRHSWQVTESRRRIDFESWGEKTPDQTYPGSDPRERTPPINVVCAIEGELYFPTAGEWTFRLERGQLNYAIEIEGAGSAEEDYQSNSREPLLFRIPSAGWRRIKVSLSPSIFGPLNSFSLSARPGVTTDFEDEAFILIGDTDHGGLEARIIPETFQQDDIRPNFALSDLSFSPDGSLVVLARNILPGGANVSVYDLTGTLLHEIHTVHTRAIALSPDNQRLAVSGVHPLEGEFLNVYRLTPEGPILSLQSETAAHQIRFSPSGDQLLLAGGSTYSTRVIDARTGQQIESYGQSHFFTAEFLGDGSEVIVGGTDNRKPLQVRATESEVANNGLPAWGPIYSLENLAPGNSFTLGRPDTTALFDLGFSIHGAGDVNGDGWDDFLAGADFSDIPDQDGNLITGAGQAFLVFGSSDIVDIGSIRTSDLNGENGIWFPGLAEWALIGLVSAAGDVNGDGFDDIMIGAQHGVNRLINPEAEQADRFSRPDVTLIYGRATDNPNAFGPNGVYDLSSPMQGTPDRPDDIRLVGGIKRGGSFYQTRIMASAGDFNNDGFDDLIIGMPATFEDAGAAYLVLGSPLGPQFENLEDYDGKNGGTEIMRGSDRGALGAESTGIGDFNGDGFDDIAVLAPRQGEFGEIYVIFGRPTDELPLNPIAPDTLTNRTQGGIISSSEEASGRIRGISAVGDVNGDGLNDLVVAGNYNSGTAFLIYGTQSSLGGNGRLDLATMTSSQGIRLQGPAAGGTFRVSGAGDPNGDGYTDFMIADRSTQGGTVHLVYGADTSYWRANGGQLVLSDSPSVDVTRFTPNAESIGTGLAISPAGDFNHDGIGDLLFSGRSRQVQVIFSPSSALRATYQTQTSASEDIAFSRNNFPAIKDVGRTGDNTSSRPLSQVAIGLSELRTQFNVPSTQTVTLNRIPIPEPASGGNFTRASLHWNISTQRQTEFSASHFVFHYAPRQVENLNLSETDIWFTSDEVPDANSVWSPLNATHNPERSTFSLTRSHDPENAPNEFNGTYALMQVALSYELAAEIPAPPSVNLDRLPPTGPVLSREPANPSDRPVIWDNNDKKLYAVRTGEYRIDWNQTDGETMASTTASFVWPESPTRYQSHVIGTPPVSLEIADIVQLHDTETDADADRVSRERQFSSDSPGRSLLRLSAAGPDASPKFILVQSLPWNQVPDFATEPAVIGTAIVPPGNLHDSSCGGPFLINPLARYCTAPGFYHPDTRSGPIVPVNVSHNPETDRLLVAYYRPGSVIDATTQSLEESTICWPHTVREYDAQWPPRTATPEIVIASELGAGEIDVDRFGTDWALYFQNDVTQPGFNPNDEHARVANNIDGQATIMPLRSDLASDSGSEPYVLMTYSNPETNTPALQLYRVVAESDEHRFNFSATAGQPILPPRPLSDDPICLENSAIDSPAIFEDRKGGHWARAAGADGLSPSQGQIQFWYAAKESYYFPSHYPRPEPGNCIPFLDLHRGTPGTPIEITYTIRWPEEAPVLKVGETLVEAMRGLPTIGIPPSQDGEGGTGPCSVEIIYQAATAQEPSRQSVRLIDPLRPHQVSTSFLPPADRTENVRGETRFRNLPPHLAERLTYRRLSDTEAALEFRGDYDRPALGSPTLLLNVISESDEEIFRALFPEDEDWQSALDQLVPLTRNRLVFTEENTNPTLLALSAGAATGTGFVTLAFQNHEASLCAEELPVTLEVIRVEGAYRGEVAVIEPDCFFDEKLTLKHKGDFGGRPGQFHFEWRLQPDGNEEESTNPTEPGSIPMSPTDPVDDWDLVASGPGETSFVIEGASPFTLSDNWLIARYRPIQDPLFSTSANPEGWSEWTPVKLAPGWIKRVLDGLTPFEQRFEDLSDPSRQLNTTVDMLSQAGRRWEGSVPLNCDAVDSFGLIEIYETVYNQASELSLSAGIAYQPANNALLLMASRIADLYLLLGHEAFADASDPTIGIVSDSPESYTAAATSLHAFSGLQATPDLLTEELVLLRGRAADTLPPVTTAPIYNRLPWNYSGDLGEVAYQLNYDIQDTPGSFDGRLDENDAADTYPQGHGDAWGHYLSSLTYYYRLLNNPLFTWIPRSETTSIGGADVTVDFVEEQKFAKAAAAKANAGAEIVNLTYRSRYLEDPQAQYQGYQDDNRERAWGLSDWGTRAGQGAYLDWVMGNATLPARSPITGQNDSRPVDRSTVRDLGDIASAYRQIQSEVDNADRGLNPLGLEKNVMPFDISASDIDANMTFFEQIYDRAITALSSAVTVFNYALNNTQQLRRQSDELSDYQSQVTEREQDFQSRLIEVFGQPYREDIGTSGTYPQGYSGPDIYHYTYADPSELLGLINNGQQLELNTQDFEVTYEQEPFEFQIGSGDLDVSIDAASGLLSSTSRTIRYHYSPNYGLVKPDNWSTRLSSGEIQSARSDLLQLVGTLRAGLANYQKLIDDIEARADLIEAQHNINRERIQILNDQAETVQGLNVAIGISRNLSLLLSTSASDAKESGEAIAEALPKVFGTSSDATAPARSAIRLSGTKAALAMSLLSNVAEAAAGDMELAKENTQLRANLRIAELEGSFALQESIAELESMIRDQEALKYEVMVQAEATAQAAAQFTAVLTKGERLLNSFTRFRLETAAAVQQQRYKNMAYRIFRNDALQKYRAQFDLASRYAYLAARAYDYETNFLPNDPRGPGEDFLNQIVRSRSLGILIDNDGDGTFEPVTGGRQGDPGLADAMARLAANWRLNLKGQLGFNNPQPDRGVFSLRFDAFNILPDNEQNTTPERSNELWQERLDGFRVSNILALPEFNRYCIPFSPRDPEEPGIVIPFATTINAGQNFFGNPLAANQEQFDSTKFSTKIRSVAVLFESLQTAGVSAQPLVYLVPLGIDIMRSPSDLSNQRTREWRILEQTLPVPFPLQRDPFSGGPPLSLTQAGWIPSLNGLNGSLGAIRRFGAFKAFAFSDPIPSSDFTRNSRLVGRSVWNNRWMLIIPGRTLLADQNEGISRFLEGPVTNFQTGERSGQGVTDIKIVFEAYSLSAN